MIRSTGQIEEDHVNVKKILEGYSLLDDNDY